MQLVRLISHTEVSWHDLLLGSMFLLDALHIVAACLSVGHQDCRGCLATSLPGICMPLCGL